MLGKGLLAESRAEERMGWWGAYGGLPRACVGWVKVCMCVMRVCKSICVYEFV